MQPPANRSQSWLAPAALSLTAILITLALYARSLRLPFYSDDLVQLAWLRGLTFRQIWGQVSPYGYYRPLAFSLWLLWRDLGLPLTPAGLRLLNLVGHALAAVLVGWLARDLDRENSPLTAALAAAFFAAYPFAYQAVPWVSAVFYPLLVVLSVGAALAYRRYRVSRSPILLAVSVLLAALAPFAHENGMLAGLLVALVEGVTWQQERPGRRIPSLLPLVHVAFNAAFMITWFRVRPGGIATLDLAPAALLANAAILVNGLDFPLAPLAVPLALTGLPLSAAVWLVALVTLGLLTWLARREWPTILFALGWFGLSVGPVLVTMRPDWLADAPRFLYPAAVGAAIWWAAAARYFRGKAQYAALLLAGAALIPGMIFAYRGVGWHLRGGEAISDAARAAQADPDTPLLLVNLPDELSSTGSLYPYFNGGAILLPPQVPAAEIAGAHSGQARSGDRALTVGTILPPVDYTRTTYGDLVEPPALAPLIEGGYAVYVTGYHGDAIRLHYAGRRLRDADALPGQPPLAYFGDFITLWGADSQVEEGLLKLALRWEIIHPEAGAPTIFVHIVDEAGQVAAQADGDPLMGLYPFSFIAEWTLLEDVHLAELPGPGPYTVYVGVWDPASGERLPVRGGDFPDGRVPVAHIESAGK